MAIFDVDQLDLPRVETMDAAYLADPQAVWRAVRERHWLVTTELGVNVLPYRANQELLRSPNMRSIRDFMSLQGITDGVLSTFWAEAVLVAKDGESHRRLRRLANQLFTPAIIGTTRPFMREIAGGLAEKFAGAGGGDFVAEFSSRYSAEIIAHLLGIPSDDVARFERWSTDVSLVLAFPIEPVRDRVEAALAGLFDLGRARHHPQHPGLHPAAVLRAPRPVVETPRRAIAGRQRRRGRDCANRDPEVFADPDRFDIARENAARQISFGGGAHHYLGAALARAELAEALPILAAAIPEVQLDGAGEWRPYSDIIIGPESMPVVCPVRALQ